MATNRTQAERGKFLNADTWDKLTGSIEKGFNEFRGNSDNKLIQILAKYQESKLGQAHTKAGKATADILFKNPYEFGQQMTNDVSDIFGMNNPNYQMRNAPGTGWGNVGKQLGRTLSTGSFIAGTGNPLGAMAYTGLAGGVGYLGNRVAGQSHKSAMSNVLPNMLESVPRGFQIAGISSLTNPLIDKAGLAGKGYWGRNLIKSPLNVVQGLAMDQATGSKTTAQSMAIDALLPFAQEGAGIAAKKFKGNLDDYLEYRKTLSPEDLQKGFVNFGAEVGGSTIKKYKPSELKYLEAEGGGIEDAVAGLPEGQTSVTKGPIEAVRTPDGLMVLDGRTRSVEAYKKGDVPIDVKILSKDEALKRWGSMFPEGLLDDIIGDGGEVKGGDLLEEARKYNSAEEFMPNQFNKLEQLLDDAWKNKDYKKFEELKIIKSDYLQTKYRPLINKSSKWEVGECSGTCLTRKDIPTLQNKSIDLYKLNPELASRVEKKILKITGERGVSFDDIQLTDREIIVTESGIERVFPITNAGKFLPKTKSQLTDIWNQANKVGGDNYYYHGTPTKNIKSIQQGGLKVGNSGAVALTKEGEESALSWAKTLYKGQDVTSVRVSKDAVNNKFLEDVDAIYSKDDIPPEMLEIKVNGKWKPLVENKEIVRDVNMDKAQEWLNRPNKTPIIKEGQGETGKYFTNVKKSSMSYPYKDYRKYSSEELTDLIKKYENVYYDTTAKVIRKKGTGEPILGRLPQKQIDSLISQGFIKIGKK